jgi:hypothetical protein
MEDLTNGYIYEIASPLELGVADYRGPALVVWRPGEDADAAQVVRVLTAQDLSEALLGAGLLTPPQSEETTP